MFFGLCNSPATFQRMMNDLFWQGIAKGWCKAYMDDILIAAETLPQLVEYTIRLLKILVDNDLFLKPEKCEFETKKVEYLGFVLEQERSLWTRRNCQELPTGRHPRPSGKSGPSLDSAIFTGDSSRNSPISLDRLPPLPKRTLSLNGYPNTKPPSRP